MSYPRSKARVGSVVIATLRNPQLAVSLAVDVGKSVVLRLMGRGRTGSRPGGCVGGGDDSAAVGIEHSIGTFTVKVFASPWWAMHIGEPLSCV